MRTQRNMWPAIDWGSLSNSIYAPADYRDELKYMELNLDLDNLDNHEIQYCCEQLFDGK